MDGNAENRSICPNAVLASIGDAYQKMNDELGEKVSNISGGTVRMRGSCDRMSVISLQDEISGSNEDDSTLTIKIRYVAQSYQQVRTDIEML